MFYKKLYLMTKFKTESIFKYYTNGKKSNLTFSVQLVFKGFLLFFGLRFNFQSQNLVGLR